MNEATITYNPNNCPKGKFYFKGFNSTKWEECAAQEAFNKLARRQDSSMFHAIVKRAYIRGNEVVETNAGFFQFIPS